MAEAKQAVLSAATTPSLFVETVERVRPNIRLIGLLALGHLVIDVNQGALSAVLHRWGVPAALWVSALLPIAGFVAAQFLPAPRDREIVAA